MEHVSRLRGRPSRGGLVLVSVALGPLLGCAREELTPRFAARRETALVVAEDLIPERRAALEDGLERWREALELPWSVTTVARPGVASIPVGFLETNWFYGRFEDEEGRIVLSTEVIEPAPLAIVTAHEIGHALGLYHVDLESRPSVMNPGNRTIAPNEADLAAVVELWWRCDERAAAAAVP
jgi:hypothetical protein